MEKQGENNDSYSSLSPPSLCPFPPPFCGWMGVLADSAGEGENGMGGKPQAATEDTMHLWEMGNTGVCVWGTGPRRPVCSAPSASF